MTLPSPDRKSNRPAPAVPMTATSGWSFDSILDSLYARYYAGDAPSSVTSSYWRTIGGQNATKDDTGYRLQGWAFGDGRSRTLRHRLTHWPIQQRLLRLLRTYHVPDRWVDAGRDVARATDRLFGFDCVKHVLAFTRIFPMLPRLRTVAIIGDGYGYGGALLAAASPGTTIVSVNLGRTLLFDVAYTQRCFPTATAALVTDDVWPSTEFVFVEAEAMERLRGRPIDLFVNIASMQEMDPAVTAEYFAVMRSSKAPHCYFYCCNREEKQLPDGVVIRFVDYPWEPSTTFFDELCPWYGAYPALRPPFWQPFDGPTRHRLVQFC
jgi:hypothetical protein